MLVLQLDPAPPLLLLLLMLFLLLQLKQARPPRQMHRCTQSLVVTDTQ
jgi:hypothetical protein